MFDEHQYLYQKDSDLKGYNDVEVDEDNVEYGNDFLNCKIIDLKQI